MFPRASFDRKFLSHFWHAVVVPELFFRGSISVKTAIGPGIGLRRQTAAGPSPDSAKITRIVMEEIDSYCIPMKCLARAAMLWTMRRLMLCISET